MPSNIKHKYEDKEMKVSEDLWAKLEQGLDNIAVEEKQKPIVWYRYAAAVVFLFGLGSLMWISQSNDSKDAVPDQFSSVENTKSNSAENITANEGSESAVAKIANEPPKEWIEHKETVKEEVKVLPVGVEKQQVVSEEKLADLTKAEKAEPKKYITSSDLLFGVEMDKVKSQKSTSAMGTNIPKADKEEPNLLKPKEIKIFGYSIYKKDSITTK